MLIGELLHFHFLDRSVSRATLEKGTGQEGEKHSRSAVKERRDRGSGEMRMRWAEWGKSLEYLIDPPTIQSTLLHGAGSKENTPASRWGSCLLVCGCFELGKKGMMTLERRPEQQWPWEPHGTNETSDSTARDLKGCELHA